MPSQGQEAFNDTSAKKTKIEYLRFLQPVQEGSPVSRGVHCNMAVGLAEASENLIHACPEPEPSFPLFSFLALVRKRCNIPRTPCPPLPEGCMVNDRMPSAVLWHQSNK